MLADGGVDKQLFFEFPPEGFLWCLAGLDFAARELPFTGKGFAGAALRGEDSAIADDDGTGDVDDL